MKISKFADKVNLPTCKYLDEFSAVKTNSSRSELTFLMGHPTFYGLTELIMPKKGYQILQKHVKIPTNHGYCLSRGILEAREAVLKLYKPKIKVDASKVFINHRVSLGMLNVLLAFVNPGDEILVPELGYPFFTEICPAINVKAVTYKLKKQSNFQIDLEHAQSLVTQKTQFLFVINPTNPMGTVFSEKHMKEIIFFADKNQLPIVADQVHIRQTFSNHEHKSFGEVTDDVPIIVLFPGWSTSWTIVFDQHGYLDQIVKNLGVLCTIFLHTNRMTQEALAELIETLGVFTHDKMYMIEQRHNYAFKRAEPIRAQGTGYLPLEIVVSEFKDIKCDREFVRLLFQEQNIKILPLSVFGQGIQGMRVMTLASEKYFDDFFDRLEQFVDHHKNDK